MKKIFFCLILCSGLLACEDPSSEREADKPKSEFSQKPDVGPYTVVFSGSDKSYQHSFDIPIRQEEGKVEYHVETPTRVEVEFLETKLKVSGCAASSVKHQVFWMPDSKNSAAGVYLSEGQTFRTQAGIRGSFVHLIRGLGGCTDIHLFTKMKVKPTPTRRCLESTSPDTCKVVAYCREEYLTNFVEAEVWQESYGMYLRKYMNRGDGTRSLMAMSSVSAAPNGTNTNYLSPRADMSLTVNEVNRQGTLMVDVSGMPTSHRLLCPN